MANGNGSGNGRVVKAWTVAGVAVAILGTVIAASVGAVNMRVAPVERDVIHNHDMLQEMKQDIAEIRSDVKELLRK